MSKEKKYSISSKKQAQLWETVHDEVMMARIKIARIVTGKDKDKTIDDVLFNLSLRASERAIDCFEIKK